MLYLLSALVILLILRVILFKGPMAEVDEKLPKGILDMHCHTAGYGAGGSGARVSDALEGSWKFLLYLKIFGTSKQELKLKGDLSLIHI